MNVLICSECVGQLLIHCPKCPFHVCLRVGRQGEAFLQERWCLFALDEEEIEEDGAWGVPFDVAQELSMHVTFPWPLTDRRDGILVQEHELCLIRDIGIHDVHRRFAQAEESTADATLHGLEKRVVLDQEMDGERREDGEKNYHRRTPGYVVEGVF